MVDLDRSSSTGVLQTSEEKVYLLDAGKGDGVIARGVDNVMEAPGDKRKGAAGIPSVGACEGEYLLEEFDGKVAHGG